jgi:hypothetical protein
MVEDLGLNSDSGLFGIEVEDGGVELRFPGWVSMHGGDENFPFSLVRDLQ